MTALLFEVAGQRYGLDVSQIIEVVPVVRLRALPGAPAHIAGLCQYRGTMVPVIDLSQLIGGTAAAERFSTRLVLVHYPDGAGQSHVLGLLAERATDGIAGETAASVSSGVATPEAPYLGRLTTDGGDTVQFVRVEQLLPEAVRARLFVEP